MRCHFQPASPVAARFLHQASICNASFFIPRGHDVPPENALRPFSRTDHRLEFSAASPTANVAHWQTNIAGGRTSLWAQM
jgi:hypothetical protein